MVRGQSTSPRIERREENDGRLEPCMALHAHQLISPTFFQKRLVVAKTGRWLCVQIRVTPVSRLLLGQTRYCGDQLAPLPAAQRCHQDRENSGRPLPLVARGRCQQLRDVSIKGHGSLVRETAQWPLARATNRETKRSASQLRTATV